MTRTIGYSVGWVVFIVAFYRGWKLAKVRTQLQDLEARLRSVDWSEASQARTQLQDLEARLRSVDRAYANRVRTQLQDLEARLHSVDRSYANLLRTVQP
jgi:phosphate uptake regulator